MSQLKKDIERFVDNSGKSIIQLFLQELYGCLFMAERFSLRFSIFDCALKLVKLYSLSSYFCI
jgi:hypothetical protein